MEQVLEANPNRHFIRDLIMISNDALNNYNTTNKILLNFMCIFFRFCQNCCKKTTFHLDSMRYSKLVMTKKIQLW